MSGSVRPHRQQPTGLPRPWVSPGKNTGVGCHFLLQCMKVKSESEVAQSCPTLCDPMDCSLPGSSIHGIFQARVLEWAAIAFSAEELVAYKYWNNFVIISQLCVCICVCIFVCTCCLTIYISWCSVAQSCPTLCNPIDYSLLGSSVHWILQGRILEWWSFHPPGECLKKCICLSSLSSSDEP